MTLFEILLAIPGGLLLIVLVFVVLVAIRPADFTITRNTTIAAPPGVVFGHINNLHQWEAWSPWAKLDPTMKQTYDGPPEGVGASHSWNGNNKVGEGKMTITESTPAERVALRLEFLRPMRAVNQSVFTLKPDAAGTVVTWTMTGTNGFMGKAFDMVMNMDRMLGKDFEKGLASLKAAAEAQSGGS